MAALVLVLIVLLGLMGAVLWTTGEFRDDPPSPWEGCQRCGVVPKGPDHDRLFHGPDKPRQADEDRLAPPPVLGWVPWYPGTPYDPGRHGPISGMGPGDTSRPQ